MSKISTMMQSVRVLLVWNINQKCFVEANQLYEEEVKVVEYHTNKL